jgi:hypothetical protein
MSAERSEQFKVRESHSRSRFTENDMTVISQTAELLHRHSALPTQLWLSQRAHERQTLMLQSSNVDSLIQLSTTVIRRFSTHYMLPKKCILHLIKAQSRHGLGWAVEGLLRPSFILLDVT